ncbi:hypothetical protein Nham_2983 [Nitrobacter hamburgensis X14]|uniref:Parallel beta-helix repeat n=1 Tax=Nitrobacter hamburgensis (strain DSM 10229 / NCIMB 13809 / X14) TaxID=323097 RepID=Q1QJ55_NITHX|nr:hypothetical protein [Nitrobacter hamburgensis]ABE63742.1 hypothetical protein Nham_2983 [Nitrobacter hamburgensis X14]
MAEGIRAPNLPLGTNLGEFIGHEIVGTTKSVKRFTRDNVLGALDAVANSFTAGGGVIFTTKAQANAALNYDANKMAWVVLDPAPANNGVYQKAGASGSGSWARLADLPYSFYRAVNEGAGSANAIQATNGYPMANTDALIVFNVTATNTSATVTLSLNGGTPLTIKTAAGNSPAVGGLVAGMMLAGYIDGTEFRLLSDQASSAIQAAAEAAQTGAESAQTAAEAARDVATGAMSTFFENLFPTKAVAEAYAPSAAPDEMWVGGIATVGDTSINLYKKNGTTSGDLIITLSDGITNVGYNAAGPVINAAACGFSSSSSAATNLAAIKTAALRTPIGGTLYIPDMGGVCNVDTSGGLTGAVLIDNAITVRIDGHIKANYAANEANPAHIFNVTGNYVRFRGSGTIEGNGFDNIDSAGGDDSIYPGLVRVTGKGFNYSGIRMLKPPKIGINLRGATSANIHDAIFEGGVATYDIEGGRYLTHITATGGGKHRFANLDFLAASADDSRATQCIFSGGNSGASQQLTITGCHAERPWEKLCYLYGQGHIVSKNIVQGPTLTDAIRIWDNDSIVEGNITFDCFGGVQALDCIRVKIVNNHFLRCSSFGVYVADTDTAYNPGAVPTLIDVSGNTITWDGTSTDRQFGISAYSSISEMYYIYIQDNKIIGFGVGSGGADYFYAIDVQTIGTHNTYNASVRRNTLVGYDRGIRVGRLSGGNVKDNDLISGNVLGILVSGGTKLEVEGNRGDDPGDVFITIDAAARCSNSRFLHNKCTGVTTIGIPNLLTSDNNYGEGNQYTGAPLVGSVTMPALASKTVSHGGVASNALIFLQPANTSAATFSGGFYCSPSGNDFAIATGSGSNAAGTEQLNYNVVQ